MTRHHRVVAVATLAWRFLSGQDLAAQTTASIEVGASVVHYETFLRSAAAYAVPTVLFESPGVSLGAGVNYVLFESGNQIVQGSLAGGALQRFGDRYRVELSGSAGLASYADAPSYGHVLGRSRFHVTGVRSGGWVGAGTGQAFVGRESGDAYEVSAGVWGVTSSGTLRASATQVWIGDIGYVDVAARARVAAGSIEFEGSGTARGGDAGAGPGLFGELALRVLLSPRVAVTVSGGRYPSDPVRAGLAASYANVGLRLTTGSRRPAPSREMQEILARAFGEARRSDGVAEVRLGVDGGRGERRITIVAPGARTVEIRGDFTDWEPVVLSRLDRTTFATGGAVTPGVYRLVVRVDGGPWIVPGGTRPQEGEFGAKVGVVVVPGR
jgi:hypothetical protein